MRPQNERRGRGPQAGFVHAIIKGLLGRIFGMFNIQLVPLGTEICPICRCRVAVPPDYACETCQAEISETIVAPPRSTWGCDVQVGQGEQEEGGKGQVTKTPDTTVTIYHPSIPPEKAVQPQRVSMGIEDWIRAREVSNSKVCGQQARIGLGFDDLLKVDVSSDD